MFIVQALATRSAESVIPVTTLRNNEVILLLLVMNIVQANYCKLFGTKRNCACCKDEKGIAWVALVVNLEA